jgi:hypothetical protein
MPPAIASIPFGDMKDFSNSFLKAKEGVKLKVPVLNLEL